MTRTYDVFVVGAGGTGSEVVNRLAGSPLRIGIAERHRIGGACNWYGCVPTKTLLRATTFAGLARTSAELGLRIPSIAIDHEALRRRIRRIIDADLSAGLAPFTDRGVDVIADEVRLVGPRRLETASGEPIEAEKVVLTTGSEAAIPPVPGLADGPYWTNVEAIWHEGPPPARLLVLGGGPIGAEFAQIFSRMGTDVTLVEASDQLLPGEARTSADVLRSTLEDDGVRVHTGTAVDHANHDGTFWTASVGGGASMIDEILVATGRRPAFERHDLDAAGVDVDDRGRPKLDDTLRTTNEDVWVAGDATGELLFTHVGDYEAGIVADDLLGAPRRRDYRVVPRVTYTDPEVASVGLTRAEAVRKGHEVVTASVPFADLERARIDAVTEGNVTLVADRASGELVGGHLAGSGAGELIHEIVIAMYGHVPVSRLAGAIHAYPTLAQGIAGALASLAAALER